MKYDKNNVCVCRYDRNTNNNGFPRKNTDFVWIFFCNFTFRRRFAFDRKTVLVKARLFTGPTDRPPFEPLRALGAESFRRFLEKNRESAPPHPPNGASSQWRLTAATTTIITVVADEGLFFFSVFWKFGSGGRVVGALTTVTNGGRSSRPGRTGDDGVNKTNINGRELFISRALTVLVKIR